MEAMSSGSHHKSCFLSKIYIALVLLAVCASCENGGTIDPHGHQNNEAADNLNQDKLHVNSESINSNTEIEPEIEEHSESKGPDTEHCVKENGHTECTKEINERVETELPKDEISIEQKYDVGSNENARVNEAFPKPNEQVADDQHVARDGTDSVAETIEQPPATGDSTTSEAKDGETETLGQVLDNVVNNSSVEANSTFVQWLKYIVDPLIEEFKDGIYPKISDKSNSTAEANSTETASNDTVVAETENVTATVEVLNTTETDSAVNVTDGKKVKFQCVGRNTTEDYNATVKLITTANLLQMLNFDKNSTENVTDCLLVMFYAPWCHFCAQTAPHYNALARAFPQLDFVAVDTAQFSNLLARFGTVAVPNILVFHHSRAAVKFNQTERTFEQFVTFVSNTTGLEPNQTVNVTEADHDGPVPSIPTNEPDYLLLISWMFVIFCSSCMFIKSAKGQQWINKVRLLWQEHQHID